MIQLDELFDLRSNIGKKIELIIEDRKITKAQLCSGAGISRPTLDKMIAGRITNKTNYDKHLEKILKYLRLTPDDLLGNMNKNRVKNIREVLRLHVDEISRMSGISIDKIRRIEAGENVSLAEMRDLAVCLQTSVNVIRGESYFDPQTTNYCLCLEDESGEERIGGFWGHIGVLTLNSKKYMWYPITNTTRRYIYHSLYNHRMVIPCMNNTVLYINMDNVQKIVLLDDACDAPYNCDWEPSIGEGEVPLVIYESLIDYELGLEETMSEKFKKTMDIIVKKHGWEEENYYYLTEKINIFYKDGRIENGLIEFSQDENISQEVALAYEGMGEDFVEDILYYEDENGEEVIINVHNIAMIELPFIELENAIIRTQMEDKD